MYSVKEFKDRLKLAFGVATDEDVPAVHPKSFCKVCNVAMGRLLDAKSKGVPYKSSVKQFYWAGHEENECKV